MLGALFHVWCACACVSVSVYASSPPVGTTAARILFATCWCIVFCLVLALRAATTTTAAHRLLRRQLVQEEDNGNVTATTEPVTACKEPPGLMSPHATHMETRKSIYYSNVFCTLKRQRVQKFSRGGGL